MFDSWNPEDPVGSIEQLVDLYDRLVVHTDKRVRLVGAKLGEFLESLDTALDDPDSEQQVEALAVKGLMFRCKVLELFTQSLTEARVAVKQKLATMTGEKHSDYERALDLMGETVHDCRLLIKAYQKNDDELEATALESLKQRAQLIDELRHRPAFKDLKLPEF